MEFINTHQIIPIACWSNGLIIFNNSNTSSIVCEYEFSIFKVLVKLCFKLIFFKFIYKGSFSYLYKISVEIKNLDKRGRDDRENNV
jgi:hypothetical protein